MISMEARMIDLLMSGRHFKLGKDELKILKKGEKIRLMTNGKFKVQYIDTIKILRITNLDVSQNQFVFEDNFFTLEFNSIINILSKITENEFLKLIDSDPNSVINLNRYKYSKGNKKRKNIPLVHYSKFIRKENLK